MTTRLYLLDRYISSIDDLRIIIEETGDDPTKPVAKQLIAACSDGILEQWLKEESDKNDFHLKIETDQFRLIKGDNKRWEHLQKLFTGNSNASIIDFRNRIELCSKPSNEQLAYLEGGNKAVLNFQFKCKEVMDEEVLIQLADKTQIIDMNKQGLQTISFEIDGGKYKAQKIELCIVGDNTPIWSTRFESGCYQIGNVRFKMIHILGGLFEMGDNYTLKYTDAQPTHKVQLSDFYIGETLVTQDLWKEVMGSNPSNFMGVNMPVESVYWDNKGKKDLSCQEFIDRLNEITGRCFRLPTEAEWEYAARGGSSSKGFIYSGSNDIDEVAWYSENSRKMTHPVKMKKPNELGLYDMSGNVYEWCLDKKGNYTEGIQINPSGANSGNTYVCRGGSWNRTADACSVFCRDDHAPGIKRSFIGFRLAMSIDNPDSSIESANNNLKDIETTIAHFQSTSTKSSRADIGGWKATPEWLEARRIEKEARDEEQKMINERKKKLENQERHTGAIQKIHTHVKDESYNKWKERYDRKHKKDL